MKRIKYLVMDVDGTLTDGKIYMGENGEVCKTFNVKDGYGIAHILMQNKIKPIIITGRESRIVENRSEELGIIEIYQNIQDKLLQLNIILKKHDRKYSTVAYIGDDLNDLDCMKKIKENGGVVGCPADANDNVKDVADFVSTKDGGDGAVREFIDWIVNISKE